MIRSTWCYKCFETFDWPIKKNFTNWPIKECFGIFIASSGS